VFSTPDMISFIGVTSMIGSYTVRLTVPFSFAFHDCPRTSDLENARNLSWA
jgi:hypothetical protein